MAANTQYKNCLKNKPKIIMTSENHSKKSLDFYYTQLSDYCTSQFPPLGLLFTWQVGVYDGL